MKIETLKFEVKRTMSKLEIIALRQALVHELAAKDINMHEVIRLNCEIMAQRTLIKRATRKIVQAQYKK